ncbi:MAG: glycerate kinase [Rhodospirillaceae bacterium]|nr:glycerate kinase [Rhodospirillaceae bacterium]
MALEPRQVLRQLFDAAVTAARPHTVVPVHLPAHFPVGPKGRLIVLGAGKAAAAMAQAVEAHWDAPLSGLVVTRDGYGVPTRAIDVVEAAHPIPDARGVAAAQRVLDLARSATADDLVLCLLSGGASALLALPAPGLSLDEKRRITSHLLQRGAAIAEINCVRKHLSAIKGGRLAQACAPAEVISLIISDVVGDDPAVIASGPTTPDSSTCADALAVLTRYGVEISAAVRDNLATGRWETPKRLDGRVTNRIIARPRDSLAAAAKVARDLGLACVNLGDGFEGTAAEIAKAHAEHARAIVHGRSAFKPPCVLLSGGEAVVTVTGRGVGGPNTEFALALALELRGAPGIHAIACDTDGTDGNGDHAGAVVTPETLARARAAGIDPAAAQSANDTATLFQAIGDLVSPGPTFTNVNDFRAVLVT